MKQKEMTPLSSILAHFFIALVVIALVYGFAGPAIVSAKSTLLTIFGAFMALIVGPGVLVAIWLSVKPSVEKFREDMKRRG